MKAYKTFDLFSQVVLILVLVIGFVTKTESLSPLSFVIGLALLQIVSLLVHFSKGLVSWKANSLRKWHLIATGLIFLLIIVAFVQDSFRSGDKYDMPGLGTLVIAGVAAFIVMVFYTVITWIEWRRIQLEK